MTAVRLEDNLDLQFQTSWCHYLASSPISPTRNEMYLSKSNKASATGYCPLATISGLPRHQVQAKLRVIGVKPALSCYCECVGKQLTICASSKYINLGLFVSNIYSSFSSALVSTNFIRFSSLAARCSTFLPIQLLSLSVCCLVLCR